MLTNSNINANKTNLAENEKSDNINILHCNPCFDDWLSLTCRHSYSQRTEDINETWLSKQFCHGNISVYP